MGFSCGIVGLPNVGKSTLFNSLSNAKAEAANFPFCTIEPNVGIVAVPDARIQALSNVVHPDKEVPTTIRFVDIAGLVRGASKGEGLGNQFLSHIREVDAVAHVVRCFADDNVTHVENRIDPVADVSTIQTELCLKDLDTANKRLDRARKQSKGNDPVEKLAVGMCERLVAHLDLGKPARSFEVSDKERRELYLGQLGGLQNSIVNGTTILQVVAAVAIGGTSIDGGRGTDAAPILGALITGVVSSGIVILGVPGDWIPLVYGICLLVAVARDRFIGTGVRRER